MRDLQRARCRSRDPNPASCATGAAVPRVIVLMIVHGRVGRRRRTLEHMRTACSTYVASGAGATRAQRAHSPSIDWDVDGRATSVRSTAAGHSGGATAPDPGDARRARKRDGCDRRARIRHLRHDRERDLAILAQGQSPPHARRRSASGARGSRGFLPQPARAGCRRQTSHRSSDRSHRRVERDDLHRSSTTSYFVVEQLLELGVSATLLTNSLPVMSLVASAEGSI